jgi:UDP-GlcNAc:undecaprenyl-phosphate/decaprenyl-phosphate GlcNAc-1-phosphate transferase
LEKLPFKIPVEHHYYEFSSSRTALMRWCLVITATLIGGLPGFLSVFIAQMLMNLGGEESSAKHGINANQASRLGGAVIFSFMLMSLLWHVYAAESLVIDSDLGVVLAAASCFFLIGLFEDLKGVLSANVRFVAMLASMAVFLFFAPQFILHHSGIAWMDEYILAFAPIGVAFTLFGVVFYVNAFNTADGANGLISGICIFTVLGLIQQGMGQEGIVAMLLGIGCLIFWLFNVTVGRIFMGDGGAYFLGAILALFLIWMVNEGQADVWYLLCLTAYPHIDLLFSMIRRKAAGGSMFDADNGHFHNLLYRRLATFASIKKQGNTVTGLLVSVCFAGLPLALYQVSPELPWLGVYVALWVVYVGVWRVLSR